MLKGILKGWEMVGEKVKNELKMGWKMEKTGNVLYVCVIINKTPHLAAITITCLPLVG